MNSEIKKKQLNPNSIGDAFKMTQEERNISFLNNYFIFKKRRSVEIQDIKIGLTQKSKMIQDEEALETLQSQQVVAKVLAEKTDEKTAKISKKKSLVLKPSKK